MLPAFSDSRLRIASARERTKRLDADFRAYAQNQPLAVVIEYDPDMGRDAHKLKLVRPIPRMLSLNAYHVAEDLRAALDMAGYDTAVAGGAVNPSSGTYFPFAGREPDLEGMIRKNCKLIPADIVQVFRSFRPYKGGDDLLWSLNRMAGISKHRLVETTVHAVAEFEFTVKGAMGTVDTPYTPEWDREKNQLVLCWMTKDSKAEYDVKTSFQIVFGAVGTIDGYAVIGTLDALATKVETIVGTTEARAREIGLLP